MDELKNPHDVFFKETLAKPEIAAGFLRNHLPPELVEKLDWAKLELQKDTFIDPDLQEFFSDLLYTVPLLPEPKEDKKNQGKKNGKPKFLYIYLLFEHKSYADKFVRLQILGYMQRIWERQKLAANTIFAVLPLVIYHGKRKWSYSTKFRPLVTAPAEVKKYVPDFEHELIDLSVIPDEMIRGTVIVRVILLVLKHIFDEDLSERLPDILALARDVFQQESGLQMLVTILRYVSRAAPAMNKDALHKAIDVAFSQKGGILKKTLAEQWIEEGKIEAQQETLLLLLNHRFQLNEEMQTTWRERLNQINSLPILTQLINDALLLPTFDAFVERFQKVIARKSVASPKIGKPKTNKTKTVATPVP